MKILTVVSGLDFINYTRRATIEAIHRISPEMDILMYNSILNIRKPKKCSATIATYHYHFWVVEKLRRYRITSMLEFLLRSKRWKRFMSTYEYIFFIDPNQYYLLPYLNNRHKVIYLLRDPSVLQNKSNYFREIRILERSDLILGISRNLCTIYFEKYYGCIPDHVKLWSNTVDLNLWNPEKWVNTRKHYERPVVGLAGNINDVIDIDLLKYIAESLPEMDFEMAGKINLTGDENIKMQMTLSLENVRHLGFIPYEEFPAVVANWDAGIVAGKLNHEYALYLNNNKQYQYLAMGLPFVSFRYGATYEDFGDFVFLADNREDYITQIRRAVEFSRSGDRRSDGYSLALNHSSDQRASEFVNMLSEIKK